MGTRYFHWFWRRPAGLDIPRWWRWQLCVRHLFRRWNGTRRSSQHCRHQRLSDIVLIHQRSRRVDSWQLRFHAAHQDSSWCTPWILCRGLWPKLSSWDIRRGRRFVRWHEYQYVTAMDNIASLFQIFCRFVGIRRRGSVHRFPSFLGSCGIRTLHRQHHCH